MLYRIGGYFYGQESSGRTEAFLRCDHTGFVSIEGENVACDINDLVVSSRLGSTPRYIKFPDGEQFETSENDQLEAMLREYIPNKKHNWIHLIESKKEWLLATILVVGLSVFIFVRVGLPLISKEVAMLVPDEYAYKLGEEMLSAMDGRWFEPSKLPEERIQSLKELFESRISATEKQYFNLEFRDAGSIGANAFALPNGTILVTDELVMMAENDFEVEAIIFHEIGHLKYRHSIQKGVQQMGLAVLIALVTGDVSSSSSLVVYLPTLLIQAGYSQEMEWQADGHALNFMIKKGINPIHFVRMMEKITKQFGADPDDVTPLVEENDETEDLESVKLRDFFSSHPVDELRIERFTEASAQREHWDF